MSDLPPLPPGFQIEGLPTAAAVPQVSAVPPLPPGFQVETVAPQPGSPAYAAQFVARQAAGQAQPQPAASPPEWSPAAAPDNVPDWARAFSTNAVESVPIAGPLLRDARNAVVPALGGQSVAGMDAADQAAGNSAPIAAGAGQLFGTVAPFVAAAGAIPGAAKVLGMEGPLLARVGFGAASSGVIGGADSLARGEDLQQSGATAALDAGAGAALPVAGNLIGRAGGGVMGWLRGGAQTDATDLIHNALRGDTDAARNITLAGPGAMVADAGPNSAGLLDLAMQRSGPGATAARNAIEGRAADANDLVSQAMLQHLGQGAGVATISQNLRAASQPAISAAYRAAYDTPLDLSSPEGATLSEVFGRVPQSIKNSAAGLMQMEGVDPMTEAVPTRKNLVINPDGSYALPDVPTVQMIDYTKRALQDAADREQGVGAMGGMTNKGRVLQGLAADLRDATSAAAPAYGHALSLAADPITARSAATFGAGMLSPAVPMDVVQQRIAAMTPAEVKSLKQGVAGRINEVVANVRQVASDPNIDARQANQAVSMLSSDAARAKLAEIPGLDVGDLTGKLDEAGRALQLRANVANNSRTFTRTAADQILNDSLNSGPVNALRQGKPTGIPRAIVQSLMKSSPKDQSAYKAKVYGIVADALTKQRGDAAQAFAKSTMEGVKSSPVLRAMLSRVIAPASVPLLVTNASDGASQ